MSSGQQHNLGNYSLDRVRSVKRECGVEMTQLICADCMQAYPISDDSESALSMRGELGTDVALKAHE